MSNLALLYAARPTIARPAAGEGVAQDGEEVGHLVLHGGVVGAGLVFAGAGFGFVERGYEGLLIEAGLLP